MNSPGDSIERSTCDSAAKLTIASASSTAAAAAGQHLGRPGEHAAVDGGLIEDLLGEVEPRAGAGGGDVMDPELLGLEELGEGVGEMSRVCRAADLVGDDDDLRLLAADPQHRLD